MPDSTLPVVYTVAPCPLGYLLVAATGQGICAVHLGDSVEQLNALLAEDFPAAQQQPDHDALRRWSAVLIAYLSGQQRELDLPLNVAGTEFQRRVWRALQAIPYGATRTYTQLADALGQPAATRAVASACAANPVALVIPCHRVLRTDGSLSGYRWGLARKDALLTMERFGPGKLAPKSMPEISEVAGHGE
jgi:AraC family transcriptional regulator, regulatory protein of adaptative response / methylated-DNA-[protein]-cysteine methyltransferase